MAINEYWVMASIGANLVLLFWVGFEPKRRDSAYMNGYARAFSDFCRTRIK